MASIIIPKLIIKEMTIENTPTKKISIVVSGYDTNSKYVGSFNILFDLKNGNCKYNLANLSNEFINDLFDNIAEELETAKVIDFSK